MALTKIGFINSFNLPYDGFTKHTELDDDIGFSTKKYIAPSLRKKLGIPNDKKYVTFIHVYLPKDKLENDQIPLIIRAELTEERDGKFFITDKYIKNRRLEPINLISRDEYFYDKEKNYFYDKKNNKIQAIEILNQIYDLHTKTSKTFGGLSLRSRILQREIQAGTYKQLALLLQWFLHISSGEKVQFDLVEQEVKPERSNQRNLINTNITEEKPAQINFFGYIIAKRTILFYSSIHLIFYVLFFFKRINIPLLNTILNNAFLTALYVILTLGIFENIFDTKLPPLIKNCTSKLWKKHYQAVFKSIKI
ncbi:MAG: hypothetical protein ACD_51C00200G0006 [uncultured bacterium]|nr:MAG: hypothetical protein ACD_51C00200G0006 [uncultured bacterium]OGJ47433.1 MAG: hypothetical protein A2244_01725 [Candidatus Peregrinibacteria bacterium RIFOXYA2_FULL_41_18]OGJ49461.1 MAG: hypothetical protein A2344_00315 [Candidatus Peregrinibacteria bacterium RIFOXYB12_FULL_41_12]OGJ53362.1 MAG: hypothetical protein A2448_01330 [Candidatus Peregrinibacteria bacterium RIFOXYC2_FULL_41_22]OGJ54361.1 MAG: hypothetical protein A2336_00200 [Candidatus Peregrinibacteria bacterium RIFOXYB2_FULL